jgi:hypothetical protein
MQEDSKMRRGVASLALVSALILVAVPVLAHHSFSAEFDANKPTTKTGFVTKIDWTNPHVWIYFNVKADDGKVVNWGFEMGPPHLLQGQGWRRDTLKIGDEVTVEGSLAKNGSNRMNARSVVDAKTGQRLGAASSQAINNTP